MARPFGAPTTTETHRAQLWITVLFTTAERTQSTLRSALDLARDLNASLEILVVRTVPYPLPLDEPAVPIAFIENQVLELASDLGPETVVHIYDCRDPEATLLQVLPPTSVVMLGVRRSWWSTKAMRLARKLRKAGHAVIVADRE